MSITGDLIRGHTDTIILAQLIKEDSYGYQINKAILDKTEGRYELKEATLYTAFRRLESAGCLTTYSLEHSSRLRKYYSITPQGVARIQEFLKEWKSVMELYSYIKGEYDREQA